MDADMEIDEELFIDVSKLNLMEQKVIDEEQSSDEDDDFMAIFLADMYMSSNLDEALKTEVKKAPKNGNLNQAGWSISNFMESESASLDEFDDPLEPEILQPTNFSPDINAITEGMDHIAVKNKEIDHELFEEMTNYIKKYIRFDQECLASLINDIILEHMPPCLAMKINRIVFAKLVDFARFVKDTETSSHIQA